MEYRVTIQGNKFCIRLSEDGDSEDEDFCGEWPIDAAPAKFASSLEEAGIQPGEKNFEGQDLILGVNCFGIMTPRNKLHEQVYNKQVYNKLPYGDEESILFSVYREPQLLKFYLNEDCPELNIFLIHQDKLYWGCVMDKQGTGAIIDCQDPYSELEKLSEICEMIGEQN